MIPLLQWARPFVVRIQFSKGKFIIGWCDQKIFNFCGALIFTFKIVSLPYLNAKLDIRQM
jgi:hypothetical protein